MATAIAPSPSEGQEIESPPAVAPPAPVLAIDTHVDTTLRMVDGKDIATRLADGHLDLPRMREGGLNAVFFSIWLYPPDYRGDAAWRQALMLVGTVRDFVEAHADQVVLCTDGPCVRATAAAGKIAFLMGLEGGDGLGTGNYGIARRRLAELYELGVRYMTITWTIDNALGHASTGAHPERGLTAMGRRLVGEMNRLGIIIDVSHVSDQTVRDILELSERPVLASHSSARAVADHRRNLPDDLIRGIAERGGAVCVNYFSQYIDDDYRARREAVEAANPERFAQNTRDHEAYDERMAAAYQLALELDPNLSPPTVARVADHIARVIQIGGDGAACLGSDFDGVPEMPVGLEDVAALPNLRGELERRRIPVAAVFAENVLRVLDAQAGPPATSP